MNESGDGFARVGGLKATLIKAPIAGETSDFDRLIAQCEISAPKLA